MSLRVNGSGRTELASPKHPTSKQRLALAMAVAGVGMALPAMAAQVTNTWQGSGGTGGDGNWNVPTNWSLGVYPNNGINTYVVLIDGGKAASSVVTLNISANIDTLAIDSDDSLIIGNALALSLYGGSIANAGSLTLASTGSYSSLSLNTSLSLSGGGTVTLAQRARIFGSGTFTNVDNTIQGETRSGSLGTNAVSIVNQGTINANVAGFAMIIDPANVTNAFVNEGTGIVRASGGGILQLNGSGLGSFTNNGTFEALDGSTFQTITGAVLTNFSAGTLTGGTYRVVSTSATATMDLGTGAITRNNANVLLSGAQSVWTSINSLTTNQGTFALANGRTFTAAGPLSNSGTVSIDAQSTLTIPGAYTQTAGTTTVDGTLSAIGSPALALEGGLLRGIGSITGAVGNTGGIIMGGDSPGTLSIVGNYTQTAGGTTLAQIAGAGAGQYSVISITGTADLSGALEVTLLGGFAPSNAQTFTILSAGSGLSGTYSSFNLPTWDQGHFEVSYTPTSVVLTAIVVPEPTILGALGAGSFVLLRRRRHRVIQRIRDGRRR